MLSNDRNNMDHLTIFRDEKSSGFISTTKHLNIFNKPYAPKGCECQSG